MTRNRVEPSFAGRRSIQALAIGVLLLLCGELDELPRVPARDSEVVLYGGGRLYRVLAGDPRDLLEPLRRDFAAGALPPPCATRLEQSVLVLEPMRRVR